MARGGSTVTVWQVTRLPPPRRQFPLFWTTRPADQQCGYSSTVLHVRWNDDCNNCECDCHALLPLPAVQGLAQSTGVLPITSFSTCSIYNNLGLLILPATNPKPGTKSHRIDVWVTQSIEVVPRIGLNYYGSVFHDLPLIRATFLRSIVCSYVFPYKSFYCKFNRHSSQFN